VSASSTTSARARKTVVEATAIIAKAGKNQADRERQPLKFLNESFRRPGETLVQRLDFTGRSLVVNDALTFLSLESGQ